MISGYGLRCHQYGHHGGTLRPCEGPRSAQISTRGLSNEAYGSTRCTCSAPWPGKRLACGRGSASRELELPRQREQEPCEQVDGVEQSQPGFAEVETEPYTRSAAKPHRDGSSSARRAERLWKRLLRAPG